MNENGNVQGPGSSSEGKWTAIGVTVKTKKRLAVLKRVFEKKLGQPATWDYFLDALLVHLGKPTWNFLIGEAVKGIKAETEPCPLPPSRIPVQARNKDREK